MFLSERQGVIARRVGGSKLLREALFIVLVGLAAFHYGSNALRTSGGAVHQFFNGGFDYSIAIMVLDGRGMVSAANADVPALRAFLNQETPTLDLDALPAEIATEAPNDLQQVRAYLLLVIAAVWWLFGISWQNLDLVVLVFHVFAALSAYALFRVTFPRWLSALLASVTMVHPLILLDMADIRDYSKTPFFLLFLALLGFALLRRHRPRPYLLTAIALGLVTGVALGFRQDFIVCIPAAFIVLALFTRLEGGRALPWRALAVMAYSITAVVTALPVPWLYVDNGSEFPHNVVMGTATVCDDSMGVRPASYERLPTNDFLYVHIVPRYFYFRNVSHKTGETPNAISLVHEKAYIASLARYFPADAVTRGLASTSALLRGQMGLSYGWPVLPIFIACGAVLLFSLSRSLALGLGLVFLVLYFGGYPSLQFMSRHLYYYAFVPWWFSAAALYGGAMLVWRWVRGLTGQAPVETSAWPAPRKVLQRLAIFAVLLIVLGGVPYAALLALQTHQVAKLVDQLDQTEIAPLETSREERSGVVLMRTQETLPDMHAEGGSYGWRGNYLMAAFEGLTSSTALWIQYTTGNGLGDFSCPVRLTVKGGAKASFDLHYFFPVYEFPFIDGPQPMGGEFIGIAMRTELAGHFKGLYRVTNDFDLTHWLSFAVPSNGEAFIPFQSVGAPRPPTGDYAFLAGESNPYGMLYRRLSTFSNSPPERETEIRAELTAWPNSEQLWYRLGATLAEQGKSLEAEAACLRSIQAHPGFEPPYATLLHLHEAAQTLPSFADRMNALAAEYPSHCEPYVYLGRAEEAREQWAAAREAYQKAVELEPTHSFARQRLTAMEERLTFQRGPQSPATAP